MGAPSIGNWLSRNDDALVSEETRHTYHRKGWRSRHTLDFSFRRYLDRIPIPVSYDSTSTSDRRYQTCSAFRLTITKMSSASSSESEESSPFYSNPLDDSDDNVATDEENNDEDRKSVV